MILTHELGHALDPDLAVLSEELYNTGKSEILYQIEVNAWNIAEGLIPFIFQDLFTFIRDESPTLYKSPDGRLKGSPYGGLFYFPLNGNSDRVCAEGENGLLNRSEATGSGK